ncbi:MAG: hypothetical protein V4578_16810 [Pseudomonadota bacterium]
MKPTIDTTSIQSICQYAQDWGFPDAIASRRMLDWRRDHELDFARSKDKAEHAELVENVASMIAWFNRVDRTLPAHERSNANAKADLLALLHFELKAPHKIA